jgi:Mn-dependent DtxR family transcriptional regulator
LTELLVTILDMRPEAADPEVHRLEHVLSDEVLARLEALVSFASSSDAWLKRLHHRIATARCERRREAGFAAGLSDIHQGLASEKEGS